MAPFGFNPPFYGQGMPCPLRNLGGYLQHISGNTQNLLGRDLHEAFLVNMLFFSLLPGKRADVEIAGAAIQEVL